MEKFNFKKKFGQNFLTDTNLLRAIVGDAGVGDQDNVLEIGAGAGALTTQLAEATKGKIVSVEIDRELKPILESNLKKYPNVELVFGDILKIAPEEIGARFSDEPFRVVANLPYYISTPIIFYLIESGLKIKNITVMLQRELVDRIVATPNTKDYGGISVILGLYGKVTKTRDVPRTLFTPQPNVDSSILSIEIYPDRQEGIVEISKVVKICFSMRRKTLSNNLLHGLNKPRAEVDAVLQSCGITSSTRAESLPKEKFIELTTALKNAKFIKNE